MKYYCFFLILVLGNQISIAQTEIYKDWTKQISGGKYAYFDGFVFDQQDNIIVSGYFTEKIVTDPTGGNDIMTLGAQDRVTFKLNENGQIIWFDRLGEGSVGYYGFFQSPKIDPQGNLNFTGVLTDSLFYEVQNGIDHIVTYGQYDIMVRQLDKNGNHNWIGQVGGDFYEFLGESFTNNLGEFYLQGEYYDTIDLDPGPGVETINQTAGEAANFILKMDAQGNKLWSKTFIENPLVIETFDNENNLYGFRTFSGEIDLDPGSGVSIVDTGGDTIRYIQKLDKDLNLLWYSAIKGRGLLDEQSSSLDAFGNIYNYGAFEDTLLLINNGEEIELISQNGYNIYIQKLDTNGNLLWTYQLPYMNIDNPISIPIIKADVFGNLFVTGRFSQSVDFDLGPDSLIVSTGSNGNVEKAYVLKINPMGDLLWLNQIDKFGEINLDSKGNVYTAGTYQSSFDADPGSGEYILNGSGFNSSAYLIKWSPEGEFIWADKIKYSNYSTVAYQFEIDKNDNLFISGSHENSNLTADDIAFITKYVQCAEILAIDEHIACDEFVWIDGNNYSESTNTPTYIYQDVNGTRCDSIIQLNLTINNSPVITTTTDGFSITADYISDEYLWLDCNNNFAPIPNSNVQTFIPSVSGSYAVQIENSGCTGISDCVDFTLVSVEETIMHSLSVFPNPMMQELNIIYPEAIDFKDLRIYDSFGKQKAIYADPRTRIDLSRFSSGLYFLKLNTSDGHSATSKVLKL